MAITKSSITPQFSTATGSAEATAVAESIERPGATRQERLHSRADAAAQSTTGNGSSASVGAAFIDGSTLKVATKL